MQISSKTKLCAIIGNPVEHSMSPIIHNAAFQELNLDFVYTAFRVRDLSAAMAGVKALGIRGLSVTVPHKHDVIPLLDECDQFAERIGAVNTIVNTNGRLAGYNTDAAGVLSALEEGDAKPAGADVLVFGAGGVSRAVVFSLVLQGGIKSLTILDPVPDKAAGLAGEATKSCGFSGITGLNSAEADIGDLLASSSLLINASPLGMTPNEKKSPVSDGTLIKDSHTLFDVVYTPRRTAFIQQGEKAGARCITGDRMFLKQAEKQFALWTGEQAPSDIMLSVFKERAGVT